MQYITLEVNPAVSVHTVNHVHLVNSGTPCSIVSQPYTSGRFPLYIDRKESCVEITWPVGVRVDISKGYLVAGCNTIPVRRKRNKLTIHIPGEFGMAIGECPRYSSGTDQPVITILETSRRIRFNAPRGWTFNLDEKQKRCSLM